MYIPRDFVVGMGSENASSLLMEVFNGGFENNKSRFTDYWKEYYWLVFEKEEITEPELHVFYEKDFTDIKFEELKQLVFDSIENMKQPQELATNE